MRSKSLFTSLALTALLGCEVAPLDPAVVTPAQRAAFATAGGGAPAGQQAQMGAMRINQLDGGYRGSGDVHDMANYTPMSWTLCRESECTLASGTNAWVSECRDTSSGTVCRERDEAGREVSRFTFYPDQRFGAEFVDGRFLGGVWHQSDRQRQQAAGRYATMSRAYETAYAEIFGQVSEQRNAPIRALEAIGDAAIANNASGATPAAVGSNTRSIAGREVRVIDGYNIGNTDVENQSRDVATRYSCSSAQSIPNQAGGACQGFRNLVIIEACTPEVVPPAAYNADQPQFLELTRLANEGSDFARMCGI